MILTQSMVVYILRYRSCTLVSIPIVLLFQTVIAKLIMCDVIMKSLAEMGVSSSWQVFNT